jgi:hypothetical protein
MPAHKGQHLFLHTDTTKRFQTVIRVNKGNLNSKMKSQESSLNFYDFDVQVSFQPIKIIYQVVPLDKLFKFLKVEDFKEELRLQAMQ